MTSATSDIRGKVVSELRVTLSVVAVAVNGWAIVTLLRYVPSLALRLTVSESVGVASYVLSIALLETALLSIPMVLIGLTLVLLKRHIHLAVYVTGCLLSLIFWYMPCEHHWPFAAACPPQLPLLGLILLLSWGTMIGIALRRFSGRINTIYAILDRLAILALFYLLIDLAAVVILAGRVLILAGRS